MTKYAVVIVKRGPFFKPRGLEAPFSYGGLAVSVMLISLATHLKGLRFTQLFTGSTVMIVCLVIHFYSKMSIVYTPLQTMVYPFHTMKFLFEINVVTAVILLPVILSVSFDAHHWTCT